MWKRSLILCFSLLLAVLAAGQSLQQTISFADEQVELGAYSNALRAYRRALYFDDGTHRLELCQKLAGCYAITLEFDKSGYFLDAAYIAAKSANAGDSTLAEIVFAKTAVLVQEGEFQFARLELLSLPDSLPNSLAQRRVFYHAVVEFHAGDFEAAEAAFMELVANNATKRQEVAELFEQNHKLKRYNPKKVRLMSVFVPGLGQMWCGDWKNGINSLVLTTGFAALFVVVATDLALIDAFVSVMPWYQRYYVGGYQSAYRIASEKISHKRFEIWQQLLTLLE